MNYLDLLSAVAPVFVVIVAGYLIRRAGWLSAEADASLLRVVVNLLYPCLILHTFLGNSAVANPANLVLAPAVGFAGVALGYGLAWYLSPFFGIHDLRQRRAFAFTAGIGNYGYIALPLVQKLFGETAAGVVFLHNVGVEAALWTVGIMLLTGTSPRAGWRKIFNVPLGAILIALTLNFLHARTWLPDFMVSAVRSLGAAAIPMGLVLTGAIFADQIRETDAPVPAGVGWGSCLLRLGLLPVLMLSVARWLPSTELREVLVVQAAMPSAVVPVILCRYHGADAPTSLRVVMATSALGLLTIPLWLHIGLAWAAP